MSPIPINYSHFHRVQATVENGGDQRVFGPRPPFNINTCASTTVLGLISQPSSGPVTVLNHD